MGRELADAFPAAREVFAEVDDALGAPLSQIMWEGPEETLRLTENTQPALMAVSLAAVRVLEQACGATVADMASYVAGHSLGEYSALAAAGSLTVADTARLVRIRGRAMQEAVPVGEGAMAALMGIDLEAARQLAEDAADGEVCAAANDNAPDQIVISGSKAAVERALEIGKDRGVRRGVLLPVSAPFHCALMTPAAEAMAEALDQVDIAAPSVPLVANVLACEISEPDEIKRRLVEQVTGTVRWRESVSYMASKGVDTVFEIGSGRVLTGLARRIERPLKAQSVGTPAEVESFQETRSG